jgi:secreted Zn-dependent insulinase-like peptidase
MDECLDILQNSPDAAPSDEVVIHFAKLAQLGEDITFQFSMDDPVAAVSFGDPKTQFTLKGFETQLEKLCKEAPPSVHFRQFPPRGPPFETIFEELTVRHAFCSVDATL